MNTYTPTSLERRADGMGILNARLPHDLAAKFKKALDARGVTATEAAREAVAMWIDGRPAVPTTSQDVERIAHVVRNAVAGCKLYRQDFNGDWPWAVDVVTKAIASAAPPTSPTISDGDRLRAAMRKEMVDATNLACRLGFRHRSAVANVLRVKGPAPLQGRLLAWVEGVEAEGARR